MHARSFALCAAAALLAAPLGVAHAQYDSNMNGTPSRFTVEGYLSQQWVKSDATNKYDGLGGVGARVMFGHSDATKVVSTFFQRARAGAFVTYFGKQGGNDLSAFHIGGQADFPLLATPMAYLDPFVSLGLGVFHTSVDGAAAGTNITSNDFAFTPAVGTLIPITGAIKFRGDLRDAIVFGDKTTNNFVAEGGISIGF